MTGMEMTTLTPPIKWPGGKYYLAQRVVALMPQHTHYVEPFAGGLAVLLAKNSDGVSEVVNDLHGHLTNFWRVLQDPDQFERFRRIVEAVPFSERELDDAHDNLDGCPDLIRCNGPFGSLSPAGNRWPAAWTASRRCPGRGPGGT
jgi:hypothetical protein